MKYWKAILFVLFFAISFFVLVSDSGGLFSFYSLIVIPLSFIAICILGFWDYKHSKSTRSIFALLGLVLGIFAFNARVAYQNYKWENEVALIVAEIEDYYKVNQHYPEDLSELENPLPQLAVERHLKYRLDKETGNFILEYTEGFSTVYNYNSERKSWENYVDWAGG